MQFRALSENNGGMWLEGIGMLGASTLFLILNNLGKSGLISTYYLQ